MGYKTPTMKRGLLTINNAVQGRPIEEKIEAMLTGKEPIKDGTPLIFTERKEGVRASTNIRTDRWMVAVDGADKIARSYQARREERQKPKETESAKTETTQGTQQTPIAV